MMVKRKHSSMKQVILAIAIALLFVFFVAYAIQTAYPAPEYTDYCDDVSKPVNVQTQAQCEELGGAWSTWERPVPEGADGWCDLYTQCNDEFRAASEPYERNVFLINLFLGLAVLIFAFFLTVEAVSTGFMGGGALLMVYGTLRYWGQLSNLLRTFFLGVALVILVYFGYKKLKD